MSETAKCELCGQPMPPGEEMFKYHGHSGPCPTQPAAKPLHVYCLDDGEQHWIVASDVVQAVQLAHERHDIPEVDECETLTCSLVSEDQELDLGCGDMGADEVRELLARMGTEAKYEEGPQGGRRITAPARVWAAAGVAGELIATTVW